MAVLSRAKTSDRSFGAKAKEAGTAGADDRKKSEFWVNFGYEEEGIFVGLPYGLPLDDMSYRKVGGGNEDFNALMSAQNDLLDDVRAEAASLEHGEEIILNLQVRVKRTNANNGPVPREANPLRRKTPLVGDHE